MRSSLSFPKRLGVGLCSLLTLGGLASAAAAPHTPFPVRSGDGAPLQDPLRPIAEISRTGFTLQYYTPKPCETRIELREGELPLTAWRPAGQPTGREKDPVRTVAGPPGTRTFHKLAVTGLKPGRRYFYRVFDPGPSPTPQERNWGAAPPWRREFAVSTLAPKGRKSILHLPVKVLLMPNVVNVASAHSGGAPAPRAEKLTDVELARIREEYAATSRFFWVNSGMRLWVDYQIHIDDRWQRWGPEPAEVDPFYRGWPASRSYPGQDFSGPGGGDFTILNPKEPLRVRKEPLYEARPFSSQVEQAFVRRWNPTARKWEFYNSGGGTFGLDQFPQGIPGRSQYLGGGDTAWLACHETHHQLESHGQFSLSYREDERIVFNHYEPRRRVTRPDGSLEETAWSTSGRHGEHWQGMAYWDRTLTDAQWLRMYFGYTVTVDDRDEDGFPDSDSRLPLDEKRFGSSPRKSRTDGRLGDLQKAMLSTWVPACNQFSFTKPPFQGFKPDPASADTDRDGQPDDVDPYPLYPWQPFIWNGRASLDGDAAEWKDIPLSGELDEGGIRLQFKQSHDESAYFGLFTVQGPWKRLYVTLDGEGQGYFSGVGVLGFEVLNGPEITVRALQVPLNPARAPGLKWKAGQGSADQTVFEFSLPNRGEGIWYWDRGGREIGASIDVFDEKGTGYSLYEPFVHFYARMLEPVGKPPLPPNAPAELTREAATLALTPDDPRLKPTGGWRREGGALRHSGEESALYVEGLNAREFDLWVDLEAKQDAILGAFLPGTRSLDAGRDYIAFVGGYQNTVTRFRLFGREEGDGEVMLTPGRHRVQLSRRGGEVWCLVDGKPVLWAPDPRPTAAIDRLAILGGYGGDQKVHEVRIRTSP